MKVLMTLLISALLVAGGGVFFIYSGIYDVSATTPDNEVVAWVVHTTSDRSVNARLGDIIVPAGFDTPAAMQAGGHIFAQNCVVCHSGPGLTPTFIAAGLNPIPPDLYRADRKPDNAENFRFIKYGVKMTAMPGFGRNLSDAQVWQLVAYLSKAPGMKSSDFLALTGYSAPPVQAALPNGG